MKFVLSVALSCLFNAPFGEKELAGALAAPAPDASAENSNGARSDFHAAGDTRSFLDGTMLAGSALLSSPSRPCAESDIGDLLLLHGSGDDDASQLSKVTSCDGASFALSFKAVVSTTWQGAWKANVVAPQSGTGSYAPGDKLICAGGIEVVAPCQFAVTTTQIVSASVAVPGFGGADGKQIVTGTTGSGAHFKAAVTISKGAIVAVTALEFAGAYTRNPSDLSAEPVSGAGVAGAKLALKMGVLAVAGDFPGHFRSMPNPNRVTTSGLGTGATLNIVGFQVGGAFTLGRDDTAALVAAVAQARKEKRKLHLPSGAYWLASQSSCIDLDDVEIEGDGWPSVYPPFSGGTTILISNTKTSTFCEMKNTTLKNLAIYYPEQDGGRAAPVVYPPTFESASFLNDTLDHVRVLNAYDLFKDDNSSAGSGWGRVFLSHMLAYCIDKCFWWQNGAADTIQFDATNCWGQGAFGLANGGPANLSRYTELNGALAVIDLDSATYRSVDGFLMTGGIVQGYRYGVRVLGGLLDVSNFGNVNWDQVGSVLSVEGQARVSSTSYSGGEVWSTNIWNPGQNANVFNIESNGRNTNLSIGGGIFVAFAQGSIVSDTAGGLGSLHVGNARFDHFGQTTTPGRFWRALARELRC